jgi:hypothetical protein
MTPRAEVLYRAKMQKTVRVLVKCLNVDSDGMAVDHNGNTNNGRKSWRPFYEWLGRDRPYLWLYHHPKAWRPIIKRRAHGRNHTHSR